MRTAIFLSAAIGLMAGAQMRAQAPAASAAAATKPSTLETETVEVTRFSAFPPAIERKPGPFVLHLVNKARTAAPDLIWASSTAPAEALLGLTSSVNVAVFLKAPRQLSVVNAPAGQYVLKSQQSGKIFFTLTIE